MGVRLKVVCHETKHTKHWNGKGLIGGIRLVPVTSGSEENKSFFEATPTGSIEFGTINEAAFAEFEPGAEYYVTIEKVPAPTPAAP